MTVIGDFAFPGEHFVLNGTINGSESDLDIEIQQMVAHVDEGLTPYFRISAQNIEDVEQILEADPTVENIERLERFDNTRFYRAHWTNGSNGLMTVLEETKGAVSSAIFHDGKWEVRLLFKDRENLTACFDQCRDELGFDISLIWVFNRSNPATYDEYGLTEEQRNALLMALKAGYFEIPSQGNVDEIAEELGISSQAVSQRLRRGYKNLVRNTIGAHNIDTGTET